METEYFSCLFPRQVNFHIQLSKKLFLFILIKRTVLPTNWIFDGQMIKILPYTKTLPIQVSLGAPFAVGFQAAFADQMLLYF